MLFTAGAIAILVEQGKLAWDKPLKDYIPELEFADEYLTNNVTIIDLLSHRTGLPSPEVFFQGTREYYDNVTHDNILKTLKYLKPTDPFRTTMIYNNYMYILVADLVTRLSGMDYKEFVNKHIFLPLGMTKSTWIEKDFIPGSVTPHKLVLTKTEFLEEVAESKVFQKKHVKTITPVFEKVSGDSGIFSCGSDMIKWVTCLMNDGKNSEGDIVIPHMDVLEKIHNPDEYCRENSGWSTLGYGKLCLFLISLACGLVVYQSKGLRILAHSGGMHGYNTFMAYCSKSKIATYVGCNSDFTGILQILGYSLKRLTKSYNEKDALAEFNKSMENYAEGNFKFMSRTINNYFCGDVIVHPKFDEFPGVYNNPYYGKITLSKHEDTGALYIQRDPEPPVPLLPYRENPEMKENEIDTTVKFFIPTMIGSDFMVEQRWRFDITDEGICLITEEEGEESNFEVIFTKLN
ncbi:hypothetical protein HDV02_006687 [Globomyces sp. JEL0801]|nr:hypothetical protein HDV02_006687 [Globomyces sp. JEL0801]